MSKRIVKLQQQRLLAGQWILSLVDYYGATFVIFGLALFQIIGVSWVYGLTNFCDDVEFMTKQRVTFYWRICWAILTPSLLLFIFVYSMAELKTLKYAAMDYPQSANIAGWLLLAIGFVQFPLWFVWSISNNSSSSIWNCIKKACQHSDEWGPSDPVIRKQWLLYKHEKQELRNTRCLETKFNVKFSQKLKDIFC